MPEPGKTESSIDTLRAIASQIPESHLGWKSDLPKDTLLQQDLPGGIKKGIPGGGQETDLLRLQQERLARERLMGEREPVPYMELQTLGLLDELEKAEGSRQEESAIEWPLTIQLQSLNQRKISMKYSVGTLVSYGGAKKVGGEGLGNGNWHIGIPGSYGFESRYVETDKDIKEVVDLGEDTKRKELVNRVEKFTRQVFTRMKLANLYGHLFKKSIESINNLATMYLASVDVGREDISSLLTLPACPEDSGKTLESVGGIKYEPGTALGRMIISAWQIFNATGFSEKPELFKDFVDNPGWKANVVASGKDDIFEQWFGDPEKWAPGITDRRNWNPKLVTRRGFDTVKREKESRGLLAEWGNVFVREESFEIPQLYRKTVAEFLGNSETAKKAVDLAWKYFRLFGSADFVGYEWYFDDNDRKLHAAIPLGSDYTSDLGKIMRPDEYNEFYHKNARGGLPRGAYGKVSPFAVDALRGINFGNNYELPGGFKSPDGKDICKQRPSLYELLFVIGVPPEKINFNKLSERAIQSPFLRWFMAAKGDEFGKGSFDKTSSKIESPEPFLNPATWEKLVSDFHVGVTKENVAWVNFVRNNATQQYKLPEDEEVRQYRLEGIRTLMDGIFADEVSIKWDDKPENWGAEFLGKLGVKGIPKKKTVGEYISHKIINVANQAVPDLNYSIGRLEQVRKNFRML